MLFVIVIDKIYNIQISLIEKSVEEFIMSELSNVRKQKVIENVKNNYQHVEKSIVEQLYMRHDLHGTTIGTAREDIWKQLFEMVVPKKFVIEQSAFIIDSKNGVSHEVDLVLLDETYTPYIFRYGKLKFIPIEAVAAVVECKSTELKERKISDWCESIENLRTADRAIARLANMVSFGPTSTQKSTRPIRILCAAKESVNAEVKKRFDFTLLASFKKTRIQVGVNPSRANLSDWYSELNLYDMDEQKIKKLKSGEQDAISNAKKALSDIKINAYQVHDKNNDCISLLTFNLQLNQLLMLINNPMLFPHRAYAEMFNKTGG